MKPDTKKNDQKPSTRQKSKKENFEIEEGFEKDGKLIGKGKNKRQRSTSVPEKKATRGRSSEKTP